MFLPNERYKYSVSLPSAEWKGRDISTPLEAVRVVYEVDSAYGEQRELLLTTWLIFFARVIISIPLF